MDPSTPTDEATTANGTLPTAETPTNGKARRNTVPPPPRPGVNNSASMVIDLTAEKLAANLARHPAEHVATFEWFRDHMVRHGMTFEKGAHKLKKPNGNPYSRDTLKHAMYGFRDAEVSLAPICEAIEVYRRAVEMPLPASGFVETRLLREIRTYLARVKARGKIGFIVGPNGCGKTVTLSYLDRQDVDLTVVRMPEGGHLSAFLAKCGKRRALGDRKTVSELGEAMITEFPSGHSVVIDEADNCFRARSAVLGNKTLDFLRRAFDEGGWALTMVMDQAGYSKLMRVEPTDPLRRLYSRRMPPLVLPPFYREDLDTFARRRGLTASPEIEHEVKFTNGNGEPDKYKAIPRVIEERVAGAHKDGLFMWLGLLDEADDMAKQEGRTITWNWVLKAYALQVAMDGSAALACARVNDGGKVK